MWRPEYYKLVTYKNKIVIPQKLHKYTVKWYHRYLLHPVLDRMETMILQHLYWPGIRAAVQREVTRCDFCRRTKRSAKTYGKSPAKMEEEKPCNKLRIYIIGPYNIRRKREETLILKSFTMIEPVTSCFEVTQ